MDRCLNLAAPEAHNVNLTSRGRRCHAGVKYPYTRADKHTLVRQGKHTRTYHHDLKAMCFDCGNTQRTRATVRPGWTCSGYLLLPRSPINPRVHDFHLQLLVFFSTQPLSCAWLAPGLMLSCWARLGQEWPLGESRAAMPCHSPASSPPPPPHHQALIAQGAL